MDIVKVNAKVVTDNTGVSFTLPVLLTEQGVIEPLLGYLLNHQRDRSPSWMNRVVQSTLLLARYMSANKSCFYNPTLLFKNFAQGCIQALSMMMGWILLKYIGCLAQTTHQI